MDHITSKRHMRRQGDHADQGKFVLRNIVLLLLAALTLSGSTMDIVKADLDKSKYPVVKSVSTLKIDFNRDWQTYTEKNKEAIILEYCNLFMGKYGGDADKFLSEGKDLFQEIQRDFEETRQAPYRKEFEEKGMTEGPWIDFGAKLLCSWENSWKDNLHHSSLWQDFVSRDEIVKLCLTKDVSRVVCKENGDPGILLVNCNKRIEKGFAGAIEGYRKIGVPNIVEILTNNGVCIFSSIYIDNPGLMATFDEYGVIYINDNDYMNKEMPDKAIPNLIKSFVYRESLGSAHLKLCALFGNKRDHFLLEATKEILASEQYLKLYEETKDRKYLVLSKSVIAEAENVAGYTHSSMEDTDLKANVAFMKRFEIVKPLHRDGWD